MYGRKNEASANLLKTDKIIDLSKENNELLNQTLKSKGDIHSSTLIFNVLQTAQALIKYTNKTYPEKINELSEIIEKMELENKRKGFRKCLRSFKILFENIEQKQVYSIKPPLDKKILWED